MYVHGQRPLFLSLYFTIYTAYGIQRSHKKNDKILKILCVHAYVLTLFVMLVQLSTYPRKGSSLLVII